MDEVLGNYSEDFVEEIEGEEDTPYSEEGEEFCILCENNRIEDLQRFIQEHSNQFIFYTRRSDGLTALELACTKNNIEVIKILTPMIKADATEDSEQMLESALEYAKEHNLLEIEQYLKTQTGNNE